MNIEIKNAVIESAAITTGERGFLDCWVFLKYSDAGGQGFGGYVLYVPKSWEYHKMESVAGHFIFRVMEVAGVTEWKDLPGKTIRVKCERSKIHAIGHIINDDWFDPKVDFSNLNKEGAES